MVILCTMINLCSMRLNNWRLIVLEVWVDLEHSFPAACVLFHMRIRDDLFM